MLCLLKISYVFLYLFICIGDNNIINGNSHIYSTHMIDSYS